MITPIEAAEVKNLGLRQVPPTRIRFQYPPPGDGTSRGKKFKQFRDLKEHIIFTARMLVVLDTHELWKIKTKTQEGVVPKFWDEIVTAIWQFKKNTEIQNNMIVPGYNRFGGNVHIAELVLGDEEEQLELFEYSEDVKYFNSYEE